MIPFSFKKVLTFSRPFVISGICVPPSLLICK
nr:MAG TPA: hypothetical protein [Caudoviricetes sp.]